MLKARRLLLVGGGSGGHIVPNLAIATEIKKQPNVELLYIGSRLPLDRQLVEADHLPFKAIFTGKLRRYFSWKNFVDPFFLLLGFFQSMGVMLSFRPQVVFSKGGFVSLPVALAAFLCRVPVILHESDSVMGLSNRIVARFAYRICTSFPQTSQSKKIITTGNPVRADIQLGDKKEGYRLTGFNSAKPVLLVWGGSLGAQQINNLVRREFKKLTADFQVIHITGKGKERDLDHKNYIQFEYVSDELKHLYAITDLVIGRAGANSLFELTVMQKPNIVIPLMINQDQMKNAKFFEEKGATIVWEKGESIHRLAMDLWNNKAGYQLMKNKLRKLSKPKAAQSIAQLILKTCE